MDRPLIAMWVSIAIIIVAIASCEAVVRKSSDELKRGCLEKHSVEQCLILFKP